MKNQTPETSHEAPVDATDPLQIDIEIGGLPYVLQADVPKEPGSFVLALAVPDEKWAEVGSAVEQRVKDDGWFSQLYRREQATHLGDGRVGSAFITSEHSDDGAPSIEISRIQSTLGYLPEDDPYHGNKGVGSATLDAVCAIADARGWRIYLEPLERDGRLMGQELNAWYEKRGFRFEDTFRHEHDLPWSRDGEDDVDRMYSAHGSMLRLPQPLDSENPIVQALASAQT